MFLYAPAHLFITGLGSGHIENIAVHFLGQLLSVGALAAATSAQ
jgi:hypothetical protein